MTSERQPLLSAARSVSSPNQRVQDAVVRYQTLHESLDDRLRWSTLSFVDDTTEHAFRLWFSSLNEGKVRKRLLLLSFLFMVYAAIETGTERGWSDAQKRSMTTARSVFVLLNCLVFVLSYISRPFYRRSAPSNCLVFSASCCVRRHIMFFSTSVSFITNLMLVFEVR